MKALSGFLLLSFLGLTSCQIDGLDPFNAKTVVPDLNARVARRLQIGGQDGKTIYAEARYQYNTAGQLDRTDNYSRNANGQMNVYSYEAYTYNANGQLTRQMTYSRAYNSSDFRAISTRNYSYPAANQTVEVYSGLNANTNSWYVSSRIETFTENGLPTKIMRYNPNSNGQFILQSTSVLTHKNGRLVTEEYKDATGKAVRTLQYNYKGRIAKVEFMGSNSSESYIQQELEYDRKGRLIRQQYRNYGVYPQYLSSSSSLYYPNVLTAFEYLD